MVKKLECDKCGVSLEDKPKAAVVVGKNYDLCNNCVKKVQEFITKKEEGMSMFDMEIGGGKF